MDLGFKDPPMDGWCILNKKGLEAEVEWMVGMYQGDTTGVEEK